MSSKEEKERDFKLRKVSERDLSMYCMTGNFCFLTLSIIKTNQTMKEASLAYVTY